MTVFEETVIHTFHVVSCYHCAVRFGIDAKLYRRAVTDAEGSIYCPACGGLTCWRESHDKKQIRELKRELETAERRAQTARREAETRRERHQHTENVLRATKGVVTKLKKRVGKGVCPCCNRYFEKLEQHMKSKHPEYANG